MGDLKIPGVTEKVIIMNKSPLTPCLPQAGSFSKRGTI
jgi:hypothetical protein